MTTAVIDVSTRTLSIAAAILVIGMVMAGVFVFTVDAGPEIREGSFVNDEAGGLFAVGAASCSTDSDCEPTTCAGSDYMVDTDGDVACTDHDSDGDTECTGYDEAYAGAEYCGGRYDYNCDSSGCDGYKAACEDSCDANSGCDTYSFCESDTSDDDSGSGSDTTTCSDACTSLTKKCSTGNVVQCQDTDSDSCTDGFVKIQSCSDSCSNGACIVTDTGDQNNGSDDTAEETTPETSGDDTDTTDEQTIDQQIAEVWTSVWTTLFGWL